jgi:hypothetical protein
MAAQLKALPAAWAFAPKAATPTLITPGHISITAAAIPRVSGVDRQAGGTKSKNGKTGRSGPQLNEKSFACMIGRGRIKALGRFANSPSGLINEPVSRERNADSQEEIDPRQETDL